MFFTRIVALFLQPADSCSFDTFVVISASYVALFITPHPAPLCLAAGVMKYLMEQFDLSKVQLRGASAGGLAVTLAACGVNQDKAVRAAYRLSMENNIWERPGGLVGIWGGLVRQWLDELLPEDAAERCNGRVKLVVTELPSLQLKYLSEFTSREDLINANMVRIWRVLL